MGLKEIVLDRLFKRRTSEEPTILAGEELRQKILESVRNSKREIKVFALAREGHIYFDLLPEILSISSGDTDIKVILALEEQMDQATRKKIQRILKQAEDRGNAEVKFIPISEVPPFPENFPQS